MPASTTFYRKYRPQKFSDVIGQTHVVRTLENALKTGKVGQAYLFTGPRGTGKTTLARLFAKAVNCSNRKGAEACGTCTHCLLVEEGRSFDIIEIDAASHTGVDNIRELRETVTLPPALGSHKVYIIDEVHMLSIGAFNALLKTLEEPPAHVIFILATTALHKLPDTIVSRCQRFDLMRFPVTSIAKKLAHIAKEEKLKVTSDALEMIAFSAEGGMRDAESLLMQIASLGESAITEEVVVQALGTTKKQNVTTLVHLIADHDLYGCLACVRQVAQSGAHLSLFATLILHYLRDLLLVNTNSDRGLALLGELTLEQKKELTELSARFTPNEIVTMLEHFQTAQQASKSAVIAELPIEIALVKTLATNPRPPIHPGPPKSPTPLTAHEKKDETKTATKTALGIEKKSSKNKVSAAPLEQSPPTAPLKKMGDSLLVSVFDLAHIKEHWVAILNTAKELNASLSLGLSTARPVETSGSTIIIAVKYPFHKERLEEAANRLTLENAFATILGTKMKLVIQVEDGKNQVLAQDENPLISQALSMLGGKVVNEA